MDRTPINDPSPALRAASPRAGRGGSGSLPLPARGEGGGEGSSKAATVRVRDALAARGLADVEVTEFAESTATAIDAAAAIGTTVGRIVKSLVFMVGDEPILILASGINRVDLEKLAQLVDGKVKRANADQVRQFTGFAIGGVPPVGHAQAIRTFVDEDLLRYDQVWAAAGTPYSVFPINPRELVRMSGGHTADLAERV